MSADSRVAFPSGDEETSSVIPPDPEEIFGIRYTRLQYLSLGHPVGEYLEAMAQLAKAQRAAFQALPARDEKHILSATYLNAGLHPYTGIWQTALATIIPEMQQCSLPIESREALLRLKSASPGKLDCCAHDMLCGNYASIDLASSPFIAAALQVYWTSLASRIRLAPAERISYLCPTCGSPPVAGVILGNRKLRYLCCSLCATQWNVPRVICTHCGSTADLAYFNIDGEDGTRSEACSRCNTYLKLHCLEKKPDAEPLADDLATLQLDLMMAERSYSRSGINLFLLPKMEYADHLLDATGFHAGA